MGDPSAVMEVPYLFPSLDNETPVFIVNDEEKTIQKQTEGSNNNATSRTSAFTDETLLRGAASVSTIQGRNAVLTTCLLVEKPWILCVALSFTTSQSPVMLQLDLGTEVKSFSNIVKVQAFAVDPWIRLNLVDEYGVIVSIILDAATLTPADTFQVMEIANLLSAGMEDHVAEASLQSSMIAFLSATRLILSLNPFIMTVDLHEEETVVWSKTECLQVMDANHSNPFTKYLSKGVGYVLGQQPNVLVDMNPTSAVCVAANDPSHVFTLHSDGIVRRWKMSIDSLAPCQVFELTVPSLPDSETWRDASHSTVLCARLYRDNFVLAIHILTNGSLSLEDASDCCLSVVHGSVQVHDASSDEQLSLQVPASATSLVGMSFDPSLGRCSLVAFFQCLDQSDLIGSIHATYPPSHVSIVGTQAVLADPAFFLEAVAEDEWARVETLSFYDVLDEGLGMEEVLHQVDSLYLKYLFRPCFPRGTGTALPPSPTHIRRALQKLVKPSGFKTETTPCSIELEVLRAIHEWRAKESRKIISMTPVKKSRPLVAPGTDMAVAQQGGMSLYESLVDEEDDDSDVVFGYADSEIDRDMESRVKSHEARWRQLLLEVWTEEQTDRVALCLAMPESQDAAILIRPGATSIITKASPSTQNALIARLDAVALKLLGAIDEDSSSALELLHIERKVWRVLSEADTALRPSCLIPLQERLTELGRGVMYEAALLEECTALEGALRELQEDELVAGLKTSPFGSDQPGLCALSSLEDSSEQASSGHNPVANSHLRLAASSLSIRSAESARRLLLGRFLVLAELSGRRQIVNTSLLMYLHSVTVSWVFAQQVAMPQTTTSNSAVPSVRFQTLGESPPKKRLSFGNGATSILSSIGIRDSTVSLDKLLISLSQRINLGPASASLAGTTTLLASVAFNASFRFTADSLGENFSFTQLPELGVLAASSGDGIAHPKLALRLLAPFVTLQPGDSPIVVTQREELLSRCLVMTSRTESAEVAADMVHRACELLKFDELDVANLMRRLRILVSHIGDDTRLSGMLLEFIQSAIDQMNDHFSAEERNSMPDYISLWSTLFNTAVAAHQWEKAYVAALNIPELERRTSSFKRLVRAMVDAGALTELIKKCASFGNESMADAHSEVFSKGVDMYAIAAETLAQASVRDLYLIRTIDPQEPLSDYQGALYALHVSQRQWKRAAQALDLRYSNAIKALESGPSGSQLGHSQAVAREGLIIDDLVLAAVGCCNAVDLIRDSDSKFIVSGEYLPHPLTLRKLSDNENGGAKRSLAGQNENIGPTENEGTGNRLDRFMSLSQLEMRAVRSEALRALFQDASTEPSFVKANFCAQDTSRGVDRIITDELFARGYYQHGLAMAKAMHKVHGSSTEGRDIFHECLTYMMSTYLVPLAVDRSHSPPRPTLAQLHSALGGLGDSESTPVIVGGRSKKVSSLARSDIRHAAMALLTSLTTTFTTAENPVAIEVADSLLEAQGNTVPLPLWLEQFLIKGTSTNSEAPGLFAGRQQKNSRDYLGDPSALLNLYTTRGMYQPAFASIAAVLSSQDESAAPSRLPEKGSIDYVPYDKIDILWNLSEIALTRGDFDAEEKQRLLESRGLMEHSLERHFDLLKISEEGQTSARALSAA